MPEIAGESAILLENPDAESIAAAAERLCDAGVRRRYSELGRANARRFSWDRTAKETIAIYSRLA